MRHARTSAAIAEMDTQPPRGEEPRQAAPDAGFSPRRVGSQIADQPKLTLDQRKQLLASEIRAQVATGGRVKSQEDFQAVVVRRVHPGRVHLIVGIFTLIWLFVWLMLELTYLPSKKRQIIAVDEFGLVTIQPADRAMATAIANALGAPQVAGSFVSPKGQTRHTAISAAGGELGGIVAFGWLRSFEWIGKTVGSILTDAVLELFPKRRARRKREGETSAAVSAPSAPSLPMNMGGYVAISPDEVVIIQVVPGLKTVRIGPGVVGRIARTAVASADLDRRRRQLRIGLLDGGSSEFEVPRIHRDTAEQVVHALGGRVN